MKLPLQMITGGFLAGCAISVSLGACATSGDALDATSMLGWTETVIDDRIDLIPIGCSDSDTTRFKVHGKNAHGDSVRGIVCCGNLWKGCTARTER